MLSWLREQLAPIASWAAAWTALGAVIGLVGAAVGSGSLGGDVWAAALVGALYLGVTGFFCGLLYHGVALRGRPPRHINARITAFYGAAIGVLPVLGLALDAARRGFALEHAVRDSIALTALGAATALYIRWRDTRRLRAWRQLADAPVPGVDQTVRRETVRRAAT